ncbi:MAG: D-glycero-beta-D-manno-heptose-7-phosphate kinase [Methanobacteriota archaeon]
MSLNEIIESFNGKKILVLGDLMVDEFLWGDVFRISPEAPVPIVSVSEKTRVPGGAGNVACNLSALGACVHVIGIVGKDSDGLELINLFSKKGIDTTGIITDESRLTTLKTRIIAKSQHVVRVDTEETELVSTTIIESLLARIKEVLGEMDAVAISDYGKGVVCPKLLDHLISQAKKNKIPIVVDPKIDHFPSYRGVTVITPNEAEAAQALGVRIKTDSDLKTTGLKLLSDLKCDSVLITRGSKGMMLFEKTGDITKIPAHSREVFDVTGAGDTVTSTLAIALASDASIIDASRIANYAAAVVVGKSGTATVSTQEILNEISEDE